MLQHIRALSNDGWYAIAARLSPAGITQAQKDTFAGILAGGAGRVRLTDGPVKGEWIHYDTADIPQPVVVPPVTPPPVTPPPVTPPPPTGTFVVVAHARI